MNRKKVAVLVVLFVLSIVYLTPILSVPTSNFHSNSAIPSYSALQSNNNSMEAVVYVPNNASFLIKDISKFLEFYNLKLSVYGSMADFSFPEPLYDNVVFELNSLRENFGISFFTTNESSLVTPFLSYSNVSSSASGVPYYYNPSDIARAYGFKWPLSQGYTGKNITITVIDAYGDPNIQYDVSAFDNVSGLPPINLQIMYPTGAVYDYNKTWAIETATDVEWAHALAPSAKIVLMITTTATTVDLQAAVSKAVSEHIGNILSLSWGLAESKLGDQALSTFSEIYKQAAQEHITVFAATGDAGAYDGTSNITVNFPSSDPYVTAVGGTSLYPWNGGFYQEAWGGNLSGTSFGSGGGYSQYFDKPYWQDPYGYHNSQRGVPDVSLNANPSTGMVVLSQGREYKVGGTSIATPIWADVLAIMDQYFNESLGFVNPLFYEISRTQLYASAFADIPGGSNGYYTGTPGWDPVTGLGTPFVGKLINASKSILSPYGDIALFKGATYNATSIVANLLIDGTSVSENFNGSTFYYLAFYYNDSNFIKYGISVNNQSVYSRYVIMQNGEQISQEEYLGPFSQKTNSYALSLMLNGNNVTMTSNGETMTANLFLTFLGLSYPAFGTEQYSSMDNLTVIPYGTFSNLGFKLADGASVTPTTVYQMHYSGVSDMGNYSSISIVKNNGNFTTEYSLNYSNGYLLGPGTEPTQIVYNLNYGDRLSGTFFLTQQASNVEWYLDGSRFSNSGEVSFNRGGYYNVTATFNFGIGSPGNLEVSRTIYIPNIYESNLNVTSTPAYATPLTVTAKINYFYDYSVKATGAIPTVFGTNTLSMSAFGYPTINTTLNGGKDGNFVLTPNKVKVSLFVFPSNASVYVNNSLTTSFRGNHQIMVTPADVEIIVNSSGYKSYFENVSLRPGTPYVSQVTLSPINSIVTISGTITDNLFSFPISGVQVSVDNVTYAYTNSSGFYVLFVLPGTHELNFSAPYYDSYNETLDISGNADVSISLSPEEVNINTIPTIQITRAFPLLFFLAYISWSVYHDSDFALYQIYYSTNPHMINSTIINVGGQNQTYAIIPYITPGKTYYVSVVVQLQDGQIYGSNIVQITYSNTVYLAVNIILLSGIIIYVFFAASFLRRRMRRRE